MKKPGPKAGKYGKKKVLPVALSSDLHIALKKLSAGYGISVSAYVERLILKELDLERANGV